MADLDLTSVTRAREEVRAHQDELRRARLDLSRSSAVLEAARGRGEDDAAATAAAEVDRLTGHLTGLLTRVRDATTDVRARSDALLRQTTPEDAVTSLSGRHPVLMLPVRLETRFSDGNQVLKVRIFPDQAHVTAHDPALTADEVAGLTWYWTTRWPAPDAGTEPGHALAEQAWAGLTARFRPARAAFLVRTYPPANAGSPDAAPRWDDLPSRSGEWSTAARAGLLPDRWCVLGFRRTGEGRHQEIFRRWGAAVPDTLAAGPTPDPGKPTSQGGMPDEPDLAWLHDPSVAEGLGMLVTVRQNDLAPGATLARDVDRLVAVGVDWTLDPEQAAAAVDSHLAAHANEGRLAFVPQGSPTNSTGTTRSGFSTDPSVVRAVAAPHRTPSVTPSALDGAAGPVAAAALGLPATTLAGIAGADLREQAWQGALLDATWAATGGYYVTEMLDPVADDPEIEASLRHHVARHLRAAGPIPTLRIGAQPYGVLPVTARDRFEPDIRRRAQGDVHRVAAALRELVEPLVASVPRLADVRRHGDVDDVLLALLQRTPVAWSLTFRSLVGPVERRAVSVFWDHLAVFQRDLTAALLNRLRCYQLTLLSELTHDEVDHPLDVPLVLKPDPGPQDPDRRSTAYLAEIRALLGHADGADILSARRDSVALLEAFLAAAAVRENLVAGKSIVADQAVALQLSEHFVAYVSRKADRLPYTVRVEQAAVAPVAAGAAVGVPTTPREFTRTVFPTITGDSTIAQFVAQEYARRVDRPGELDRPEDALHRLHRMGRALETLEQAPADQLEWAFRGTLDLYSTRLDAWVTSLATARLAEHREVAPTGLHVGGWGVVEDLRPDTGPAAESLGFVHAPSLGQATSMAVLRSARQTHRDSNGRLFDLDLTSRRVREALRVLEGMGNGQRLAALLGYRIERGLQDRDVRLAQWILPLRQQCPLRSERPDDASVVEPVEVVAARDVVDGLALLDRWATERSALLAAAGVATGARADVGAVLDDVAALADAVSDVLMSESVHQATVGNLERSGAALAAHDRQGPAPDPEFVRTPREGPVLTHRVGVWLPRDATGAAPGWPTDLRSLAEPRLDRWLGTVLGRPSRWTVTARLVRPPVPDADGTVPAGAPPVVVPLPPAGVDDLGMSALSVVLAARRPGDGQSSELEQRLALLASRSSAALAAQPTPADRLDLGTDGLAQLLDLASWAADVVGAAPLAAEHLSSGAELGAAGGGATVAVAEAVDRAAAVLDAAEDAVDAVQDAVDAWTAGPDAGTERALVDALLGLVEIDSTDVLPSDPASGLGAHAAEVVARLRARLTAAAALPLPVAPVPAAGDLVAPGVAEAPEVVRARAVVRLVLGNGQPFLPVLEPVDPAPLQASLARRDLLLGGDPTAVVAWLHRSALVRPQLDPLAALLVHAEADGADVGGQLQVVQTPHREAPWVALPFGEAGPPPVGTVGLVLHSAEPVRPAGGGAGLVVDAWTESLPTTEQTTAVTFHYDAPGARAPQAVLLAVHPALSPSAWDFGTLVGCVNEAVDLAHLRTIGSPELAPFATLLPALFLPDTYTRDVPGVRFAELAAHVAALGAGGLVLDHVLGKGAKEHA